MAKNIPRKRHYYGDEEDYESLDDCCCDCDCQKVCLSLVPPLKSSLLIGTACFLVILYATAGFQTETVRHELLGGWNLSIAERFIKPSKVLQEQNERTNTSRTLYVITPTYARPNQKSILTALSQTYYFVKEFHWIIIEDSQTLTPWLRDLLDRFNFNFTQIACDRKAYCRTRDCKKMTGKGSIPRNCGLVWLKESGIQDGVLYFADDDNTYDMRLFDEIRKTRRLSIFPVGGFDGPGLSSPVVVNGKLTNFIDPWIANRKWPVDMAGFATGIGAWRKMKCPLFTHTKGFLETNFIEAMNVTKDNVEILAHNATEMLVWHNTIKKVPCTKDHEVWKKAKRGISKSNLDVLEKKVNC